MICWLAISSYSRYVMLTVRSRPVPLTIPMTPKRLATTLSNPMNTPPITVTRGIYRSRYFSRTCGFRR
jgi:hypothetical protein